MGRLEDGDPGVASAGVAQPIGAGPVPPRVQPKSPALSFGLQLKEGNPPASHRGGWRSLDTEQLLRDLFEPQFVHWDVGIHQGCPTA